MGFLTDSDQKRLQTLFISLEKNDTAAESQDVLHTLGAEPIESAKGFAKLVASPYLVKQRNKKEYIQRLVLSGTSNCRERGT